MPWLMTRPRPGPRALRRARHHPITCCPDLAAGSGRREEEVGPDGGRGRNQSRADGGAAGASRTLMRLERVPQHPCHTAAIPAVHALAPTRTRTPPPPPPGLGHTAAQPPPLSSLPFPFPFPLSTSTCGHARLQPPRGLRYPAPGTALKERRPFWLTLSPPLSGHTEYPH